AIDVNDAFSKTFGQNEDERARVNKLRALLGDRLRLPLLSGDETGTFDGEPPSELLHQIKRSFEATRQETWRLRFFGAAATMFAILALAAVAFGWQATIARKRAEFERNRALTTQSEFLIRASDGELKTEHPTVATLLALEALPKSEHDSRPWLPQGDAALY